MSTQPGSVLILLPAKARQAVYVTYGLIVIGTGATQVGYAAVEGLAQPTWLTVTLAVVAFLGVPVSALAATNVAAAQPNQPDGFSSGH